MFPTLVRAVHYGVPQLRPRYIMIAIDRDVLPHDNGIDPYTWLAAIRKTFLKKKGLPPRRPVSVKEAISDLELKGKKIVPCEDTDGYTRIQYREPRTHYQMLLHGKLNGTAPNSMRIVKHTDKVRKRFAKILATAPRGVQLNRKNRRNLGTKKMCIVPLNPKKPSHTLTSLPDDLIHYSEPRILTARIRQAAVISRLVRIQGQVFHRWKQARSRMPTVHTDCQRCSPFLAEVVGLLLARIASEIGRERKPGKALGARRRLRT